MVVYPNIVSYILIAAGHRGGDEPDAVCGVSPSLTIYNIYILIIIYIYILISAGHRGGDEPDAVCGVVPLLLRVAHGGHGPLLAKLQPPRRQLSHSFIFIFVFIHFDILLNLLITSLLSSPRIWTSFR